MDTDKIYAEHIANEYAPKDNTKVKQLKKLDRSAKLPAIIFAYTFGIIGALVLGVGMCLAMKVIGQGVVPFAIGIVVGVIGIVMCSVNFPIYKKLIEKGKMKYGSDIIKLASEISEENN